MALKRKARNQQQTQHLPPHDGPLTGVTKTEFASKQISWYRAAVKVIPLVAVAAFTTFLLVDATLWARQLVTTFDENLLTESSSLLLEGVALTAEASVIPPPQSFGSQPIESFREALAPAPTPTNFALFYHFYVPFNGSGSDPQTALDMLPEQLKVMGDSMAANYPNETLPVFVNSIGSKISVDTLNKTCHDNGLHCIPMQHHERAFEEVTISQLHRYCAEFPDNRVIYMHNKGSFRPNENQKWWRKYMTQAVAHPDCLQPPDETCNVCGLVLHARPWLHFSGNFFVAQCSYVRQLKPVLEFQTEMNKLYNVTLEHVAAGRFMNHTKHVGAYYAIGRWSMEAWVGSHPTVRPCDMSVPSTRVFWHNNHSAKELEENFRFSLAPHQDVFENKPLAHLFPIRARQYTLLGGNILKWLHLYGEIPPPESWVWKSFPDATEWRNAYEKYGTNVVHDFLNTLR